MGIFDRFREKKEYINEIIAKIDCDCSVFEVKDVQSVMRRYRDALREGKMEGYTPLIIIPSEMLAESVDTEADPEYSRDSRESILTKAEEIDVKETLRRLLDELMNMDEDEDEDIAGEFSLGEQLDEFLSIGDVLNRKIILAKIPSDKPWEAAAWIPMGGFNDCPMPEEQVAVFKYWYEKYGAIPALVTQDVWEFYVERPPRTQEEAEKLAWEQFGFCSDIVWQGVGSVKSLAGTLINSSVWYFWWD